MLYGPSYISFEYALSYYGVIPEKVYTVTSATLGRSRVYATEFGTFTYNKLKESTYSIGIELILAQRTPFLMAAPEKALADKIALERKFNIRSIKHMQEYLLENLRVDISTLDPIKLQSIADTYGMKRIDLLASAVRELK
jgi:hypothetical protein